VKCHCTAHLDQRQQEVAKDKEKDSFNMTHKGENERPKVNQASTSAFKKSSSRDAHYEPNDVKDSQEVEPSVK
jgi:hypothetical protein